MGFFIRKGINFGPVRVNFSKSGVGVSLGTKGLRLGAGPKGAYVQGGRHGLYYRKGLTNNLLGGINLKWLIFLSAILVGLVYWAWKSGIVTVNL